MNNKGFTMVELLVSMAILALLTVMAFPTLRSIDVANTNKKMEAYGDSLVSAAKLYTDSYESDMFVNENDAILLSFEDLYEKKLIKDINLKGSSCKGSQVAVAKNGDNYIYCLNLICDKDGISFEVDDSKNECKDYKTYRLTYNSNYASNSDLKSKNTKERYFKESNFKGESLPLKSSISSFNITGYKFAGWFTDPSTKLSSYYDTNPVVLNKNINLYGLWCNECQNKSYCTPDISKHTCDYTLKCSTGYREVNAHTYNATCSLNSYTLKYKNVKNENISETKKFTDEYTLASKKSITISFDMGTTGLNKPSNQTKNYTFNGWSASTKEIDVSTAKNGTSKWTGTSTKVNTFSRLTPKHNAVVNLTGSWTGPTFTLPDLSKPGYSCHWETTIGDSATEFEGGASYKPSTVISRTFKAVCKINTYNLSFNKNGGTGTANPISKTYKSTWGTLPTVTKSGLGFLEWNTNINKTGTTITSSSIATKDLVVYAIWSLKDQDGPSVTYYKYESGNPNGNTSGLEQYTGDWYSGYVMAVPVLNSHATKHQYSLDGGKTVYTLNDSYLNVTGEGTSKVTFRACDSYGCTKWSTVKSVKLDRTKPTISHNFDGQKGSLYGNQKVNGAIKPAFDPLYDENYAFLDHTVKYTPDIVDNVSGINSKSIQCKKWKSIEDKPSKYFYSSTSFSTVSFSDDMQTSDSENMIDQYYMMYECKVSVTDNASNSTSKTVKFAKGNGWKIINATQYLDNNNNGALKDWYYYMNGKKVTGWHYLYWYTPDLYPNGDFKWYYFYTGNETSSYNGRNGSGRTGLMARGWLKNIGGFKNWYYFTVDSYWWSSSFRYPDGSMYYGGDHTIGDEIFTFDRSGACIKGSGCPLK